MFEYLGILGAVILGLSLTHLLRGLSKLIQQRLCVAWLATAIAYITFTSLDKIAVQ